MGKSSSLIQRMDKDREHLITVRIKVSGGPLTLAALQVLSTSIAGLAQLHVDGKFISLGATQDIDTNGE